MGFENILGVAGRADAEDFQGTPLLDDLLDQRAGTLDPAIGGPAIDLNQAANRRRTLYGLVTAMMAFGTGWFASIVFRRD